MFRFPLSRGDTIPADWSRPLTESAGAGRLDRARSGPCEGGASAPAAAAARAPVSAVTALAASWLSDDPQPGHRVEVPVQGQQGSPVPQAQVGDDDVQPRQGMTASAQPPVQLTRVGPVALLEGESVQRVEQRELEKGAKPCSAGATCRMPRPSSSASSGTRFRRWWRLQLEAIIRRTPFFPDLDDDLYLLSFHSEI